MRSLLMLGMILALVVSGLPQQPGRPIPPGMRKADQLPGPADVPAVNQPKHSRPSPEVMRDQARELVALAQTIPEDVSQVTKGALPKDMSEKLKRIEKLSKTLRGELNR